MQGLELLHGDIYCDSKVFSAAPGSGVACSSGALVPPMSRRSPSDTPAAYLISPARSQQYQDSPERKCALSDELSDELLIEGDDTLFDSRRGGHRSTGGCCATLTGYTSTSSGRSTPTSCGPSSSIYPLTCNNSVPTSLDEAAGTAALRGPLSGPQPRLERTGLNPPRLHLGPEQQPNRDPAPSPHQPAPASSSTPASDGAAAVAVARDTPTDVPGTAGSATAAPESAAGGYAATTTAAAATAAAAAAAAVGGDDEGPFLPRPFHPVDVQLARVLAGAAQALHASPAQLLQVMLNFAPEDYPDLVNAVAESGSSFVHLLACHLHNLRTMAEEAIQGTEDADEPPPADADTPGGAAPAAQRPSKPRAGASQAASSSSDDAQEDDPEARAAREALRDSIVAQYRMVVCRLVETALKLVQSNQLPPQAFPQPPPPLPPPPPAAQTGRSPGGGHRARAEPPGGRHRPQGATATPVRGGPSNQPAPSSPFAQQSSSPFSSRPPPPPPPPPRSNPAGPAATLPSPVRAGEAAAARGASAASAAPVGGAAGPRPAAATAAAITSPDAETNQLVTQVVQTVMQSLGPGPAAEVAQALSTHAGVASAMSLPAPYAMVPAAAAAAAATAGSGSSRPQAVVLLPSGRVTAGGMQPLPEAAIEISCRGRSRSLSAVATAPAGRRGGAAGAGGMPPRGSATAHPYVVGGAGVPQAMNQAAVTAAAAAAAAAAATAAVQQQQQRQQLARAQATQAMQSAAQLRYMAGPSVSTGGQIISSHGLADNGWIQEQLDAVFIQQQQQQQEQEQEQLQLLGLLAVSNPAALIGVSPAGGSVSGGVGAALAGLSLGQTLSTDPLAVAAATQLLHQSYGTGSQYDNTALWAAAQQQQQQQQLASLAPTTSTATWQAAVQQQQQQQQQQRLHHKLRLQQQQQQQQQQLMQQHDNMMLRQGWLQAGGSGPAGAPQYLSAALLQGASGLLQSWGPL